jgi:hypothetical protein
VSDNSSETPQFPLPYVNTGPTLVHRRVVESLLDSEPAANFAFPFGAGATVNQNSKWKFQLNRAMVSEILGAIRN